MAKQTAGKQSGGEPLSEHEGMLLALLSREQPSTAYQLYRIFEQSPISSINASKGQLYPAIRRLRERRLIKAVKVAGDGRNAEQLSVSEKGLRAVRAWLRRIDLTHVVMDDPLRTRMLSLDLLTREEQLQWVAQAKSLVKAKQELLAEYIESVDIPYQSIANQSAAEALRAKMEWLDELLFAVAAERGD